VLRLKSLKGLGKHVRISDEVRSALKRVVTPRGPSPPQERLWQMVKAVYPDAEQEKPGLVPGRRYVVDIVIPRVRLAIELDGWANHGMHKAGFLRDREKDRALLLANYRVLRFTAGEVLKNPSRVMATLEQVVEMLENERSS